MYQINDKEKHLCKVIVDAAYQVHRHLGPGLLEKIYEVCFCYELNKKGVQVERQTEVPVIYDGVKLEKVLKLDVLVEDLIICELKAVDIVNPVWEAQVLSHLKISGRKIGFRINFNVSLIKDGIRRYCRE